MMSDLAKSGLGTFFFFLGLAVLAVALKWAEMGLPGFGCK